MVKSPSSPAWMPDLPREQMCDDIHEFSTKFELPQLDEPGLLDDELMHFRTAFMQEELDEILDAYQMGDSEAVLDGITDLMYVVLGTAWMMNVPILEAWGRVHTANMKKEKVVDASESKRNSPYDLKKPEGWSHPYLGDLINHD